MQYATTVGCESLEPRRLLAVTLDLASVLPTSGQAFASERVGDTVYIADQNGGIYVYSVHDQMAPVARGHFQTASAALDIAVQGNFAYVASARGMEVLNVSDPLNIRSVGVFPSAENVTAIAVRDQVAYLGTGTSLMIVNIAQPENPTLISRLSNVGASDIELYGNALYAADSTRGLRAVSIANPSSPVLVSTRLDGFHVMDLATADGFLFAATTNNGIFSFSIATNPGSPTQISNTPALQGQIIRGIDISGPNIFAATSTNLFMLDALNPRILTAVSQYPLGQTVVSDVRAKGGAILLSAGSAGVQLIEARDVIGAVTNGVLHVLGSGASDEITIRSTGPTIVAQRNGIVQRFSAESVTSGIRVNAVAGDDFVQLVNISLPATLGGGQGRDTLLGGNGDDYIRGGRGGDRIEGGPGNDYILGEAGRDSILAGQGDDYVDAGEGNDTVQAGLGNDTVFGGDGDDLLIGGEGNDYMHGKAGNDTLMGKAGNDTLIAGVGFDLVLAVDGMLDRITANGDQDEIEMDPLLDILG